MPLLSLVFVPQNNNADSRRLVAAYMQIYSLMDADEPDLTAAERQQQAQQLAASVYAEVGNGQWAPGYGQLQRHFGSQAGVDRFFQALSDDDEWIWTGAEATPVAAAPPANGADDRAWRRFEWCVDTPVPPADNKKNIHRSFW